MPAVQSKSQREFFDEEFSGPIYVHAPLVYSRERIQARAAGRPLNRQQELEITAGFMRKMDLQLKGHEMDMCHSKYRIGRITDCKTDASHTTRIKFKIYKDTEKGRKAYRMIKAGRMRGLSLTSVETATPTRVLEVKGVRVALCFRGARDGTWLEEEEEMKNENGNYKPFDSENNKSFISQNKVAASSTTENNKNDDTQILYGLPLVSRGIIDDISDENDCIPDDEFRHFQSIPCFCECEGACSISVSAGNASASSSSSSETVVTDEKLIYLRVEATNEMSDSQSSSDSSVPSTGGGAAVPTATTTTNVSDNNNKGISNPPPATGANNAATAETSTKTDQSKTKQQIDDATSGKNKKPLNPALTELNRKRREEAEARRRSSGQNQNQNGRRRNDGASSDMASDDRDGYDAESSSSADSGGRRGGFEDESRSIDDRMRDLTKPAFRSSGTPMLDDIRNEYSRAREERAAAQSELRLMREELQRLKQSPQPQVPNPQITTKENAVPSIVGQTRDAAENERIRQLEAELRDAREALDMTAMAYIDEVQNVTSKPLSEINKTKIRKEWTDSTKRQRYVDDLNDLKNYSQPSQPLQRSNNYNNNNRRMSNQQAPRMAVAAASKFGGGNSGGKRMRGSRGGGGGRRHEVVDEEGDYGSDRENDDVEEDNRSSRDGLFGMLSSSRVSASRLSSSSANRRTAPPPPRKQSNNNRTTTTTARKVVAASNNNNTPKMGSEETLRRLKAEVRATKRFRNENENEEDGGDADDAEETDTASTTKKQQMTENPFKAHIKAAFHEVTAHPAAHPETGKTYLVHKAVFDLLQKARKEYNNGQIQFEPMTEPKAVNSV